MRRSREPGHGTSAGPEARVLFPAALLDEAPAFPRQRVSLPWTDAPSRHAHRRAGRFAPYGARFRTAPPRYDAILRRRRTDAKNEILSVGLILIAALLAGHLAQLLRAPEVTGYLLVGVLIGPAALDLISHENITTLSFLSDVALGLILFNIGAIFESCNFRHVGPGVVRITLWEATLAFGLVCAVLVVGGMTWPLALLLASSRWKRRRRRR